MGNVYVQFREEEQAANALHNLNGRFYAGLLSYTFFVYFLFPLGFSFYNEMNLVGAIGVQ